MGMNFKDQIRNFFPAYFLGDTAPNKGLGTLEKILINDEVRQVAWRHRINLYQKPGGVGGWFNSEDLKVPKSLIGTLSGKKTADDFRHLGTQRQSMKTVFQARPGLGGNFLLGIP